jgi:KaiC/GvpD/RAD55 family RecA-like ATPase
MEAKAGERIPTGIEGLDMLIEGGLLKRTTVALLGQPGAGKSIFCENFVWEGLKRNDYVLYFVLDFPPWELARRMNRFKWDISPYKSEDPLRKRLYVVDAFSGSTDVPQQTFKEQLFVKNPSNLDEFFAVFDGLLQNVSSYASYDSVIRIVLDSVSPILSMTPDFSRVYRFLRRLVVRVNLVDNAVAIFTAHLGMHGKHIETSLKQLTGNTLELIRRIDEGETRKFLRIEHLRETYHTNKMIPYAIADEGFVINPQALI